MVGMNSKENVLRAIHHESPHHVPYYGEGALQFVDYAGAMPPPNAADAWGVCWKMTRGDLLPYPVGYPAKTAADIMALSFPDPHQPGLFADVRRVADPVHSLVIGRHICALFERYSALLGKEEALVSLLTAPDEAKAALRRICDWQLEIAKGYLGAGVEAGRISDDYGGQHALLMSPATWRRLIKPELARLCQIYRDHGRLVFLHSCGNLTDIMDDLVELGINVFNIQTSANDLVLYKKRYGRRITIQGGLDTQRLMTQGTPDEVRAAALACIRDLGTNGGLILEPDQHVPMPQQNIQALVRTAQEFGVYPLKGT